MNDFLQGISRLQAVARCGTVTVLVV